VRLAAAEGDYEQADRFLAGFLDAAPRAPGGPALPPGRTVEDEITLQCLYQALLRAAPLATGMSWRPRYVAESDWRTWGTLAIQAGLQAQQRRAERDLLRGWLALEAGACTEAARHFRSVEALIVPDERWWPELRKLGGVPRNVELMLMTQLRPRQISALELTAYYLGYLEKNGSAARAPAPAGGVNRPGGGG
jgi:hypothetical protein